LIQTVEMKVRIDCEGCERKVKKALDDMKGDDYARPQPLFFSGPWP
jgi:copper chaperone CopZ